MTDAINTKVKALELANIHSATPAEVVARAAAYDAFLAGTAGAAKNPAGAANSNKPGAGAATGANKPGAAASAKPGAAAGAKPDAAKPGAAAGAKPDAAKGAGNKPAAGATTGAAVAPDTKAPGGKHNYGEVVNALRQVKEKSSKDDALAILAEDGGGAKSVRDLKPALYDAVVEACNNVINGDGGGDDGATAGQVEDPTAQEPRDELGL